MLHCSIAHNHKQSCNSGFLIVDIVPMECIIQPMCVCDHKSVTSHACYLCTGTLGHLRKDSDMQVKAIAMTAEGGDDSDEVPVERTITVGFADEETKTAK